MAKSFKNKELYSWKIRTRYSQGLRRVERAGEQVAHAWVFRGVKNFLDNGLHDDYIPVQKYGGNVMEEFIEEIFFDQHVSENHDGGAVRQLIVKRNIEKKTKKDVQVD